MSSFFNGDYFQMIGEMLNHLRDIPQISHFFAKNKLCLSPGGQERRLFESESSIFVAIAKS